jgi:Secreted protein containing C-terminal beta-propeller domain distantly related to WD-40 repeats
MGNWKLVMVAALGSLVIAAIIGTALVSEDAGAGTYGDLQKFASKEEIRAFLKEHAQIVGSDSDYSWSPGGAGQETVANAPAPASTAAPTSSARDYSTTNVQVEGVDEADFVKNDGKHIYIISGETLAILEAFPAKDAKIVSETRIDGSPTALFLAGDRLVVFATATEEQMTTPEGSVTPVPVWRTVTHAYVYGLGDREDPELVRTLTFTGDYYDARMVGDYVYTLTRESPVWVRDDIVLPEVRGARPRLSGPTSITHKAPCRATSSTQQAPSPSGAIRAPPTPRRFSSATTPPSSHRRRTCISATGTQDRCISPGHQQTAPAPGTGRSSTGSRSSKERSTIRPWERFPEIS